MPPDDLPPDDVDLPRILMAGPVERQAAQKVYLDARRALCSNTRERRADPEMFELELLDEEMCAEHVNLWQLAQLSVYLDLPIAQLLTKQLSQAEEGQIIAVADEVLRRQP
jgi:hypothetical protein